MHAVGDVADGNFFFDAPRPKVGPHAARDVAVQSADGVGPARELEAEDGHAERFVFVLRFDAAEAHQLVVRDAELVAQRAKMLFDQGPPSKAVVAGGHGRVRGEDGVMGDFAQGFVETSGRRHPSAGEWLRAWRTRCALRSDDIRPA